jgi:SAM-dependent methyltransferase
MLSAQLDGIDQAQCDATAARLAGIAAGVEEAARVAEDDEQPLPYDAPLNFTKFFAMMGAVAGDTGLKGKSVLDVGCGGGGFMAQALGLGMQPTGIDIYSGQAHGRRSAERLLAAVGLGTAEIEQRVLDADITQPIGSLTGRFDFAASAGMLEHIPEAADRDEAVRNMIRALKPGGTLLLECGPNARSPIDLFHYGPKYPLYHVVPESIKRVYMDKLIRPRRPDLNDVQSHPQFLSGVSVTRIESAIRSVDPGAEIVQAFPTLTRLAVTRQVLRRRRVQMAVGAVSKALVAAKAEPLIMIVARRATN